MPDKSTEDGPLIEPHVGDFWFFSSYYEMYLQAANDLLQKATETNSLENTCIPLFFLQRHTLELSMKEILSHLYHLQNIDEEVTQRPSKNMLKRLTDSHSLECLMHDLKRSTIALGIDDLYPKELDDLVAMICKYDHDEYRGTWSRYECTKNGDKHIKDPIQIPSNAIQKQLTKVMSKLFFKSKDGTYNPFEEGTLEGAINNKLLKYDPEFFY